MEKGYNTIAASELLGISYRTMRKYIKDGTVKAYKIPGTRRWIIMESELKRLQGRNENDESEN